MISKAKRRSETFAAVLETSELSVRRIGDLFAETFTAGDVAVSFGDTGRGRWRLRLHFQSVPNRKAVRALAAAAAGPAAARALRFERLKAKDWAGESLATLRPVEAGRFVIHGAHNRAFVPKGCTAIQIEAALAFGTGHHGTTRGCLLALDRMLRMTSVGPRRKLHILDLGTGTGILAIAAARTLRRRVLAVDIDPTSVRVARDNARLNEVAPLITIRRGNGVAGLRSDAPFDLMFVNILLRPLQRLAAPLTNLIAPGGRLILSGVLASQANALRTAYPRLTLERRIDLEGWSTLVFARAKPTATAVARRRPRS